MLEHYPQYDEPFKNFIGNTIKQLVRSQSIAGTFKVKEYAGSRYETTVKGQPSIVEMKAYDTKFLLSADYIRKMDLVAVRKEIYEGCKKTAKELDQDLIKEISKVGKHIPVKTETFLEDFLSGILDIKRQGGDPMIFVNPEVYKKLYAETMKPENQAKIRKFMVEMDDGPK